MGRVFLVDLEGKTYNCKFCKTQLARADQLISKEKSHEESQKYKEGKFVLERFYFSLPLFIFL
uniref:Protein yippee n=1 Tax=Solanum tuberosum TaxID=4113 RepID=M1AX58_SOLTU